MTREEAIKELKIIREEYWDEYGDPMPALDMAIEALSQEPCEDAISRDDALMCMTGEYIADREYKPEDIISKHIRRLRALPPVQPKYNAEEWCKDCSEYDRDKYCCPRYNGAIRKAVEEIKQAKTGRWITKPHVYGVTYCSECDFELKIDNTKYCPNCGAKMESEES